MSGLAEVLIHNKHKVSGSDIQSSPITKKLETDGGKIYI
jgi:UDP-N-acetylmuramate--alanine ligase